MKTFIKYFWAIIYMQNISAAEYGSWTTMLGNCGGLYRVSSPEKNAYGDNYFSNYQIKTTSYHYPIKIKFIYGPMWENERKYKKGQWNFNEENQLHAGRVGFKSTNRITIRCSTRFD